MESRVPLLCSKWTVVETHSLLVARAGRESALRWLQGLGVLVVPVTPDDEDRSLEILRSHEDKDFTLVDASSFAIMERLGIRHYHSYDRRFRQYGKFAAVAPSMF